MAGSIDTEIFKKSWQQNDENDDFGCSDSEWKKEDSVLQV